jgi:uncharacterized protein YlzI (FlbEa/FlbD family)
MKFIKLTTFPGGYEFFVNVDYIESIATRYNVLDKPMGGTNVLMSSGKEHLVKESAEQIIAEINWKDPEWYDILNMDQTLETIYKEKGNIENE